MSWGLGFHGGAQTAAGTSLVPPGTTHAPKYSYEYGAELIIPVDDEVFLRPLYSIHRFGAYTAPGVDASNGRTYSQSATGTLQLLGAKLSINTLINKGGTRRFYFGGGGGRVVLKTGVIRHYSSGGSESFLRDGKGSSLYWEAHIGISELVVQNWAMGLEAGFRSYNVSNIGYLADTDLSNAPITGSKAIRSSGGVEGAYYKVKDGFLNLTLNLCF